ncbi:MAG: dihydroorotate dehydrogenase [Desulfarculus sp.]|nr:dihydroorotate dehydrogenase [Desulfarculus sp.]
MSKSVDMAVTVGADRPVRLKNPVIAASGTFGYGLEYADQLDLGAIGGFVTKGVSLKPRDGNPPPRICETAAGMLNAIGLANVGLEVFLGEKLPKLRKLDTAVVVNLYGEAVEEFAELARRLSEAGGVAALELNVSCPNVKAGGMAFGCAPGPVGEITAAVRAVTDLPVWVKLTPNVTDPVGIARAAAAAGADALCLINTLLGMAIDARRKRPRLANLYGGLSGPAIKPVALRMVHQVSRAVAIPVVGLGGIVTGEDAAEFLLAGASAVQVGTANFLDPAACLRVAAELEDFCADQGVTAVADLVGGLAA